MAEPDDAAHRVRVAISMMPGSAFAAATHPLFAAGEIDALEWTYELGFAEGGLPDAVAGLLDAFAAASAVSFHGVSASVLGVEPPGFAAMLERLAPLARRLRPTRLTEHLGFELAPGFARSTVLPVPFGRRAVQNARDRLARLAHATGGVEVGLENLAFAFSRRDVDAEPEFLEAILAPLDGCIVLDLHNLHCRAANFGFDPVTLLARYPVERIRMLHVSGGSESAVEARHGGGRVRRDTHDHGVPDEVFALLGHALATLPRVDTVVVEHLPTALADEPARMRLREDVRRTRRVVREARR